MQSLYRIVYKKDILQGLAYSELLQKIKKKCFMDLKIKIPSFHRPKQVHSIFLNGTTEALMIID